MDLVEFQSTSKPYSANCGKTLELAATKETPIFSLIQLFNLQKNTCCCEGHELRVAPPLWTIYPLVMKHGLENAPFLDEVFS